MTVARHGDVRLTLGTYHDENFAAMEEAVKAMERLGLIITRPITRKPHLGESPLEISRAGGGIFSFSL
jgi:hypothetical protein